MSEIRFKANARQKEALKLLFDDIHSSIGFGGGAGGGKTILGCFWCWAQCTMYPGVSYFIGRDTLKNLKATTLESYYKFVSLYNIPLQQQGKFNSETSKIKFENGSEIPLLELKYYPSDPLVTALGSHEFTGGYIEESAEVDIRVIDVLYSRIGRRANDTYGIKAKILEGFNPAKNHVYTRFYKPYREGQLKPGIAFVPALASDWLTYPDHFRQTHSMHPDEPDGWWKDYINSLLERSEVTRQRLLWGNFEYDDDKNALCTYDAITDAFKNEHVIPNRKRCITADIALQGSDMFAVGVWDGFVLIHVEMIPKSDGKQVIDKITQLKIKYQVPNSQIVYDNDGVGGFIGGFLTGAKPFVNNATPTLMKGDKENYQNLKSQCYYALARRINDRQIWLKAIDSNPVWKEKTIEELEQIKAHDIDKDGKLKIIPKEIVKVNIGRSPDISDMLMMREYIELTPRPKGLSVGNR
jgi:phage terminase large subunit